MIQIKFSIKISNLISPIDKRLRGYSSLYTYLRMQLKNYVLKQGINVSGFEAELEPDKYQKRLKMQQKDCSFTK